RPTNREHAALAWRVPAAIDMAVLAPADRPVVHGLRLPPRYAITPEADRARVVALLEGLLARGDVMAQLRLPSWPPEAVRALVAPDREACRERRVTLLLNGDIEGARQLGATVGVHLRAAQLGTLGERPLPPEQWVAASCHDSAELQRAAALADFAVL